MIEYWHKYNPFAWLCALLPWSVEWTVSDGVRMHLLSEPMMLALAGMVAVQGWRRPSQWAGIWAAHRWPLALVLGLLAWGWISTCFSTLPWVSVKYMLVNTLYVVVFLGYPLLNRTRWAQGMAVLLYSLLGSALYFLARHWWGFGGRSDQANLAAMPFFDDHNQLAAVLGMAALGALAWQRNQWLSLALAVPVLLSTSRGGVLGVLAGGVLFVLYINFKNRAKWVVGAGIALLALFLVFYPEKINEQFKKEVSMAERWNRYQCALRMANDRPLVGFGPGTYAVQYIPYQQAADKTRISLDAPLTYRDPSNYGHGGGAHSEYLQALSETGWPGLLLLLVFVGWPLFAAVPITPKRIWLLAAWSSYWMHGLLNNFWHDPKVVALVLGVFFLLVEEREG